MTVLVTVFNDSDLLALRNYVYFVLLLSLFKIIFINIYVLVSHFRPLVFLGIRTMFIIDA